MEEGAEAVCKFIKAGEDAAAMLQEAKLTFDFMPFFIEMFIIFTLVFAVLFWWDNRDRILLCNER